MLPAVVLTLCTWLAACSERPKPTAASGPASPAAAGAGPVSFELVATRKLSQLIGDHDKHLKRPTDGQTHAKFGVLGTDLGYSFEDDGRTLFLFGDTIGTDGQNGSDAIGFTDDTNPDDGVSLEFFTRPDGRFLPFRPVDADGREQRLDGYEVPVAGIRVGGVTYVAYKDNHAAETEGTRDPDDPYAAPTDVTRLARFDATSGRATTLCELSRQPDGKFQKITLNHPVGQAGLPDGGPWVLVHGTGAHRASDPYLAIVPVSSLATCKGARYAVKLEGGAPVWSEREADAGPIFTDAGAAAGTIGELSITYAAPVQRWIATYDAKDARRGVYLRHAADPWGPWSEPIKLFDPAVGGFGTFIHDPSRPADDGQAGPMIGKDKTHPEKARGILYAPFVVERWTKLEDDTLALYFVLSTWNPYTVVLMRSDLKVVRQP